jgi:multidrug efflux pump subunit AcrA (membrane-fusion protein)
MKDGKAVAVKTGRQEGDRVEILEGLKAGDEIRVPKTEAAKPEPAKSGESKPAAQAPDPAKKG